MAEKKVEYFGLECNYCSLPVVWMHSFIHKVAIKFFLIHKYQHKIKLVFKFGHKLFDLVYSSVPRLILRHSNRVLIYTA